ncbi:hypothetical protein F5Y17DRAFT_25312 [Xylariaceae sp. FL0594]|nr:hypothetical protein F5Y17DRAFT_25312 [Xylariaceae sp. FL0594]
MAFGLIANNCLLTHVLLQSNAEIYFYLMNNLFSLFSFTGLLKIELFARTFIISWVEGPISSHAVAVLESGDIIHSAWMYLHCQHYYSNAGLRLIFPGPSQDTPYLYSIHY